MVYFYLSPLIRSLKHLKDFSSLTLREFVYAGAWKKGALNLANVLAGTAIAAVTRINREKRREITVFYQTKRLDLASQVNDEGWAPGQSMESMRNGIN